MREIKDETLEAFNKEAKKRERKEKLKNAWNECANFVRDNKDVLIMAVPVVVTVVGGVTKVTSKAIGAYATNREITFKERTIYDRSLGRYIELKRPLTSRQAKEIEERRANGEKLTTILESMGLVKR